MEEQALIIGQGAIGTAVAECCLEDDRYARVTTVSRRDEEPRSAGHRHLRCDHSDSAIAACVEAISADAEHLSRVIITLGTLHGPDYGPEKALRQLHSATMLEVHRINCVLPLIWVAALAPLLRRADDCRIAVLSARVGSITDNRRGGWYSYRSAKASLNMGLRCAAIELAQRHQGVKLIAYHPGTVDSNLSAPFQARLPPEQLFTPAFAAQRLLEVVDGAPPDGELAFLDWAGSAVPW